MAKKKTHGKKKSGKTQHHKKETGYPTTSLTGTIPDVGESYELLYDTWNSMTRNIESRIMENIEHQQKTYHDFYSKWMKFTEKMGNRMTKTTPGHKYREAYDVWRNYANRMNNRLSKFMTKGRKSYEKLDKYWQDYSGTLGEEITRAATGDMKPWEFKDIHETWTGFAGEMQEYIRSTTDYSTEELEEISQVWYDFSKKMQDVVTELNEDGDAYDDFTDLWTSTSKEIGNTLQTMLKKNNGDLEKLQKTWFDYCSKLEKEIVDTSRKIGVDYDELWKWYFDNQKAWYGWWSRSLKSDNNDLKKEVQELQRRVQTLEKKYSK